MPVARITRSADSVRPSESSTAFVPSGCWRISRTVTPQWIGMFRVASQRRAWSAAGASSIRGSTLPFALDHRQLPVPLVHRIEHDEADEAGADEHHARRASCRLQRFGVLQHAIGVRERPERLHARQIGAADRRAGAGDDPVAISRLSKSSLLPSLSVTVLRLRIDRPRRGRRSGSRPSAARSRPRRRYACALRGCSPASQYGSAMRECAGSSQTSVMADPPPSNSRIVSTALVAAGPPPMMT